MPKETISPELIQRSIEISSNAFRTRFLQVTTPGVGDSRSKNIEQQDSTVGFRLSQQGETTIIEFLIALNSSQNFLLRGSLKTTQREWLEPLASTVQDLIAKEIELWEQDHLLTDYASQISRDFEELVWTREFAKRIQRTDIRNSLGEFVEEIFPTLMETVQTKQLVLIQYLAPISKTSKIPELKDCEVQKLGSGLVEIEAVHEILSRYSERGRRQPVVCNHCSTLGIEHLKAFMLVPIQSKEQEFGWILAINHVEDSGHFEAQPPELYNSMQYSEFGSFEAGLMQSTASFLASHANNISLYSDKKHLLINIVRALVNAIDAKDHYTCGHSDRVAKISKKLAHQLGLPDEECEEIYMAGLLHDIGKIGVPDRVLLKRDRLTGEEMEVLKQHPVIGYNVLKQLKQIAYILPGVRHHHESLDGSGYPDGLVGEQIPFPARIIAVADAFDAMTSNRPYRQGMPLEVAESILSENNGPQWDPIVLEAFFQAKEQIQSLCYQSIENESKSIHPDFELIQSNSSAYS